MLKQKYTLALTPLLLILNTQNVSAFGGYGSDVDDFCAGYNGTTPYNDQGCNLCHEGSKGNYVAPEWDWWWDGELANFCGTIAMNEPPVLDPIGNQMVSEGEMLQIMVTATDPNGDALTMSAANLPTGASFIDNGNGTANFSWGPEYNQAGNYPVTIIVNDNGNPAESDSEEIVITVGNLNRPPALDPIGSRSVNYDETLSVLLTTSDPDGDNLTMSAANLPTGASFFDNGDGTAELDWTPGSDQMGNYPVLFTVNDDGEPMASDSEEIIITVGGMLNRPPVLDPIGNRSVNISEALEVTLTSSDPDGDTLSFTANSLPNGASLDDNGNGMATFRWMPAMGQAGNHAVTFNVNDDGVPAGNDSEEIMITVGSVESRPPALDPIGNRSVFEGEQVEIMLTASDPDGNNDLSFTVDGLPQNAVFQDNGNGTAMITWVTAMGDAGDYSITSMVMDGEMPQGTDSETFMLSVKTKVVGESVVYIHKAKAHPKKMRLSVKGKRAPASTAVTISDADSGYVFGTTETNPDGKWQYRGSYGDTLPCRIRVEIEGQTAEQDVVFAPERMTPASCGGYEAPVEDDDHDDHGKGDDDDDHDAKEKKDWKKEWIKRWKQYRDDRDD